MQKISTFFEMHWCVCRSRLVEKNVCWSHISLEYLFSEIHSKGYRFINDWKIGIQIDSVSLQADVLFYCLQFDQLIICFKKNGSNGRYFQTYNSTIWYVLLKQSVAVPFAANDLSSKSRTKKWKKLLILCLQLVNCNRMWKSNKDEITFLTMINYGNEKWLLGMSMIWWSTEFEENIE